MHTFSLFKRESYTFTVGYHELTGSQVTLKRPLLVLKKVKGFMDVDQADDNSSNNKGDLPSSKVELDVIGIIRHKILFKARPKASKPQSLVKERARAAGHPVPN
uniref:Chromosome transmission fidelity protein 8 n=1 Tax=Populus trichocarpa TaxID=3694 RepID=B9I4B9_POPTR